MKALPTSLPDVVRSRILQVLREKAPVESALGVSILIPGWAMTYEGWGERCMDMDLPRTGLLERAAMYARESIKSWKRAAPDYNLHVVYAVHDMTLGPYGFTFGIFRHLGDPDDFEVDWDGFTTGPV